ncbi:hypothetical protein C6496_06895 [Candidatus Poribacteria bacterium]|nr:MAG: hypothetical protein C6496_06895 [Candidatus Poribacteria bacterium]
MILDDILGRLFKNDRKPDFCEIRQSFIDYVKLESDILKVCDFDKKRNNGIYIGYNPNNRNMPTYFLSAGFNDAHSDLENVTLYASWVTRYDPKILDSHYSPLESHKEKIEKLFDFRKLDFLNIGGAHKIGVSQYHVDLTDKENIHSHFKWLRHNLEKLYWLIRIHENGCI